jgi:5-amino-6-(5-phosphoribosylamino)uracil reductase
MSIDGKIGSPERTHASLGSAEDRRRMSVQRAKADAIIVGASTLRAHPHALIEDSGSPRKVPIWNVVMTRSLNLPFDKKVFDDPRVRWMVLTRLDAKAPELARAREVAEVLQLPMVTPKAALDALAYRGVKKVLLESGGDVASQFFHADCVDELYLTVVPLILGGKGAPSPADGETWPAGRAPRLKLVKSEAKGDELFLHYRR